VLDLVKSGVRSLFPSHTARGRVIRKWTSKLGLSRDSWWTQSFETYIHSVEPKSFRRPIVTGEAADTLFSIVIPFFNTPDKYLLPLLDSLASQSFQQWELVMADASTDQSRSRRIEQLSHSDPRFRYIRLAGNGGISRNTNEALQHTAGKFIVFADHDDMLSPHALNEMAWAITEHPDVDILYSDEDVLSDDGRNRKGPFFKPSWSPHMFLEMNYTNHLSVVRADLIKQVGGLCPDFDGAQDYDLLLRIHAQLPDAVVVHIPKILYHWREAEHSTARSMKTKTYAVDAGSAALDGYLDAVGVEHDKTSNVANRPGWYRVHPRQRCTADVVVMTAEDSGANQQFADLLRLRTRSTWVTADYSCLPPTADLQAYCQERGRDVVVAVREMFLPEDESWLDELVGVLALPRTAAVAPLLIGNIHNHVVNAGLMEKMGQLRPLYQGCDLIQGGGLAGPPDLVRDVDGLSPEVVVFPRTTEHVDLFTPHEVDGRTWRDQLVLWGHLRFMLNRLPYRDRLFNDNLALSGTTVLLRNELDVRWD